LCWDVFDGSFAPKLRACMSHPRGNVFVADGTRKRRHSSNRVKRQWYARHRAIRFARRLIARSIA